MVLTIDTSHKVAPTRDLPASHSLPSSLPAAKATQVPPGEGDKAEKNAKLFFVGTATTILEWEGLRLMTDPNFLHAGDHVHLGPGVTATRKTNPAVDLHDLPHIDMVLLSHYHADHFDQEVEASLRRDLPIVTTPHAHSHLSNKGDGESFTSTHAVDFWESILVDIGTEFPCQIPRIKVTGMPGKHVPSGGFLEAANEFLGAVPPTNGWMVELGYGKAKAGGEEADGDFQCSYRIYISGDTLNVSDLAAIPEHYTHVGKPIDLMLIHLGGTTIPSPSVPLLMVTMDAKQGVELLKLVQPNVTIPIHYDDYDVFLSNLDDFKAEVEKAGLQQKVVYLDRGDAYEFGIQKQ